MTTITTPNLDSIFFGEPMFNDVGSMATTFFGEPVTALGTVYITSGAFPVGLFFALARQGEM